MGKSVTSLLNDIQSLLESAVIIDDTAEGEKNKKAKDANPTATQGEQQSAELLVESDGKELIIHNLEKKKSEGIISVEDDSNEDDKQPLSKRFKIMTPIPDIPNLTPLNTFLFKTTSSRFSPTPPKEPTPPRDSSKGKAVAIMEEPGNELVQYQEERGSDPKVPKLKPFITPEGPLSQEEFNNQIKELKRISDLKAEKEKLEQELRKLFNPATLKAQAQKWTEHEAKKANMMEEYNHQISYRADRLPITKISYIVNSIKEATMKITRGDNSLNLIVHPNFRLKSLGFREWLEAKRLGLPPPPELATFGLIAEEKKRKRTKFIKQVFLTRDVRVDGMDRNLIPPPLVLPIQGLVINEPESEIFFMNGNTEIGFQREKIRLSIGEPLSGGLRGKEDQLSAKHQLAVKGLSECTA
ncbi:hypothetical protein Tco_0733581 [Tanacetum coccineum]